MKHPDHLRPPKWPLRFFRWYCHPDYLEDIEGDLRERFERRVQDEGMRVARRGFCKDVIRLFRPGIIRSWTLNFQPNHHDMFQSYFKIGWRNLFKQKLYSFINIGGLAVGLTCFVLIFLYVQHELSYDRFYPNADRIYRIYQQQVGADYLGSDYFAVTPPQVASVLMEEFPEVSRATSLEQHWALLGQAEDHYWEEGIWADAHFFEVFAFPFIQGNPKTALENPESIVLTQSLAEKIFGDNNPLGQPLLYQNETPYTVTGVIVDPPQNTSFQFSFLTGFQSNRQYVEKMKQTKWDNNFVHTFLLLDERANPQAFQQKLPALLDKYQDPEGYPFQNTYFVQSLFDVHLQTNINFDIGQKGNPRYITLFSLIALIVLLLACVNYMNLAVARSIHRAQEVGLRKVAGAVRGQLIGQFLGESLLMTFLALLLALGLTYGLAPVFSQLVERPIVLYFWQNAWLVLGLLILVVIVGLLSGSYPALFMSSLHPAQVLKANTKGQLSGMKIQRWLMVGQYAISIVLVISSLVIYHQLQFMQQKELGYDKDQIVAIEVQDRSLRRKNNALRTELLRNPGVIAVTVSSDLPTHITSSTIINDEEGSSQEDDLAIYDIRVDHDFLAVYGIPLVAGRNFSQQIASDRKQGYLINEMAAKALGWTPEEAIGQQFTHDSVVTVIGVVKDFHMHSLHLPIQPLMLRLRDIYTAHISVKVRPEKLTETIASLEKTVGQYSSYPFEYQFLDESFDKLYKSEVRVGKTFGFFTLLAILIASLGLFGLAAYSAKQRTKEIGIRKVLGASVRSIVGILAQDFLKMVLIGFLLAIPIAWYLMSHWLQDFAYRIAMEWWMFALAGTFALGDCPLYH